MSFFCLFLFIVMVFWRPQEWLVPALYGWPILDGVVFLSLLAMLLEWDSGKIKMDGKCPQYFLLLGLFIAALMSHVSHGYLAGLLENWVTAFRICFFSLLLFSTMTSVNRLMWVLRVFVFMACFMAIHGILQQDRGYGFGGLHPIMSWRPNIEGAVPRSQFYGIFNDPNDMGQMMATAMPMSFVIFKRKSILSFAVGCAICYLLWVGIEGTWSRGSQIGIAVAAAVILIQMFPPRWFLRLLIACVVAGLGMLPFAGRFLEGSALERMDFWGQANWAFRSSPIFGVGLGMIREYIDKDRAVHNAYVSCYSELGVFGYYFWFCLVMVAILGLFWTKIALPKKPSGVDLRWLQRFAGLGLAALGGFMSSSYFLSRAFIFPLFFLLAMYGAVPFLANELLENSGEEPNVRLPTQDVCLKIGIPASLVSIAYVYVSILLLNMAR